MKYDPDLRAITIYQDTSLLFKSVLLALLGGFLGVPILWYLRSRKRAFQIPTLLAGALLLLWEAQFWPAVHRFLVPRPVVVVDDQGLDCRPLSSWLVANGMSMRWEEMAALCITELTIRGKKRTAKFRFLSVISKDEAQYSQQHKLLRPRRLPQLVLMSKTGSPFLLFEQLIYPDNLDELLSQIRAHFAERIQVNGIAIREEQTLTVD